MPHNTSDVPRRVRRKPSAHPVSIAINRTHTHIGPSLSSLKLRLSDLRPGQSLNLLAHEALAFTNADGAAIAIAEGDTVICRARAGSLAPPLGTTVSRDSGISAACMSSGEVACCNDTNTDPRVNADACRESGIRSMLAVPLRYDGTSLGVFAAFSKQVGAFGEREIEALVLLSGMVPLPQATTHSAPKVEQPVMPLAESVQIAAPENSVPRSPQKKSQSRPPSSARQIAVALETIRQDPALRLLGRVKAYLTIESLYDGLERNDAVDLCQELMFERAQELGVVLKEG